MKHSKRSMKPAIFVALCSMFFYSFLLAPLSAQAEYVTASIPVGSNPLDAAVNPVTNKTYVTNNDSQTVTVIDGETNAAVTVSVGGSPGAVAVNSITNKIYVGNRGSDSVTVIDGATNATATVAVGSCPMAIAVNSITNKIYVANFYSANVTVIDGQSNATSTITVGTSPNAVAVNPVTNKIYVANMNSASVTVIDGTTNAVETVTAGSGPASIAVNPVANKIYVSNYWGNTVTVIDGATNSTATIAAGSYPTAVAANPVTNKIYVTNAGSYNVTVIDGSTEGTTTIAADWQPGAVSVNTVTNKIYVANRSVVTIIDGATNATSTISAGSYPVAVTANPITNKVYVVNNWSKNVSVIDGAKNVTTTIEAGSSPSSVAVNAVTNKVYVTNYLADTVTMIDGETNTTATIATGSYPYQASVNPVTNKIYVSNYNSDTVTIIDGLTNTTTTVAVGANPGHIKVNPVTNKIYVSNNGTNTVTVIDGATNGTTSVAVGLFPTALAINLITNKIYVVSHVDNNVTVINGDTNDTAAVPVGLSPRAVDVNNITNRVYVANYESSSITVIDGATNVPTTVAVGSLPHDIAVNTFTNRIYVTNHAGSSVTVIDGATNSTSSVGAGAFPEDVTVSPATDKIYVVNNGDASVTVIDGATNSTVSVAVGSSPIALAVNPATNKIYVANYTSANVTAISEQEVQPIPLTVTITPLEGNAALVSNPTISYTTISTYSPVTPAVQNIYYQVDTWTGAWQRAIAGDNGGSFTIPSQIVGLHTVYAFAGDGQEATSTNKTTFIPGSMTAYTLMTPQTAPDAPTGVTAIAGYESATVTFTAPAYDGGSPITAYIVISNPAGGVDSTGGSPDTTHIMTGLVNGTAYTFKVAAINSVGTGPESEPSNSVIPWGTPPNNFSFIDQANVPLSTLVTSNTVTVTGITGGVPISITGGQYEINNSGLWTSQTGTVSNKNQVRIRLMSSSAYSTTTNAVLAIGGVSDTFSVTTLPLDATPDPFAFTDQAGVQINMLVSSNTITITGITIPVSIAVVGGEYSINGGVYTSLTGSVVNGQAVTIRLTSSSSASTTVEATLFIGEMSAVFTVTTAGAEALDADGDGIADVLDNCPAVFNPDQTDANGFGFGDACTQVHCVHTSAELQNALNSAKINNENNIVKISQGTYGLSGNNRSAFSYQADKPYSLVLQGGYSGVSLDCAVRELNPANTVLDGENIDQGFGSPGVLYIFGLNSTASAQLVVDGISIRNGRAYNNGGMLLWSNGNRIVVSNSIIQNNTAANEVGGINMGSSNSVNLIGNIISNNSASIGGGASVYVNNPGSAIVSGNVITDNHASALYAGLCLFVAGNADVINNTVSGNGAGTQSGAGFYLHIGNYTTVVNMYSNVIWGNASQQEGEVFIENAYPGSTVNAFNNDFDPDKVSGTFTNQGSNLNGDPLFKNQSAGDYHLSSNSPLIDAGENSAPSMLSKDLDGNPRVLGQYVDIGAYEFLDRMPDVFVFESQVDVSLNSEVISNSITVTGINTPASISIAGGEYSIDGGLYTSGTGTVTNGQTITVRHKSSSSYSTAIDTTLTIGEVSASFTSTTHRWVPDGDFGGDGIVDMTDALQALRIAAGLATATSGDLLHGDVSPLVNGQPQPDGKIDVGDVVVLLRRAVGLITW